jgi:DNA-binding MarR family transcriptional regulator
MQNIGLQLLECIRGLQQRNRFIVTAGEAPLTLTESHLVVEIELAPGISPADLARKLMVQRSTVSRALKALGQRGLVQCKPHKSLKRGMHVWLAAKTKKLLPDWNAGADERLKKLFERLDKKQQQQLGKYIHLLSDGLAVPESAARTGHHPLRCPIRRMTRGVGILSDDFMRSGVSSSAWQILESTAEYEQVTTLELVNLLGVARSTMSLLLKRLERDGLLKRTTDNEDKRRTNFSLTAKGKKTLARVQAQAAERLDKAAGSLSAKEKNDFLQLFSCMSRDSREEGQSTSIRFHHVTSQKELQKARGWVLRVLVGRNLENYAPAEIAGPGFCAMLASGSRQLGLLEIQQQKKFHGRWQLSLLIVAPGAAAFMVSGLLKFGFEKFFALYPAAEVQIAVRSKVVDLELAAGQKSAAKTAVVVNSSNWSGRIE